MARNENALVERKGSQKRLTPRGPTVEQMQEMVPGALVPGIETLSPSRVDEIAQAVQKMDEADDKAAAMQPAPTSKQEAEFVESLKDVRDYNERTARGSGPRKYWFMR